MDEVTLERVAALDQEITRLKNSDRQSKNRAKQLAKACRRFFVDVVDDLYSRSLVAERCEHIFYSAHTPVHSNQATVL